MSNIKIESLLLENFARVYGGLSKTKIFIDLTNVTETVNLFVGLNGSGKTSIMQCMHPFAFNNAMGDSGPNADLIMDNKSGKKEIVISCDNDVYRIQHVYNRAKSGTITVKSYILKNNEELNSSGTSTSFKAIVQDELGITETFLTLLSIGNRVDGFVEYISSERKNLIIKIFDDLHVYDMYYKKMGALERKRKTLLSNVVSKLSKYSGMNLDDLRKRLDEVQKNIQILTDKKSSTLQYIGGINSQLSEMKDITETYHNNQTRMLELLNDINKIKDMRNTTDDMSTLKTSLSEYTNKTIKLSSRIAELTASRTFTLDNKNEAQNQKIELNDELSNMLDGQDKTSVSEELASINQELETLKNITLKTSLDRGTLIKMSVHLDALNGICNNLLLLPYNTSKENIIKWTSNYSSSELTRLHNRTVGLQQDLSNMETVIHNGVVIKTPIIRHKCTDPDCEYKTFFDQYMKALKMKDTEYSTEYSKAKANFLAVDEKYQVLCIYKHIEDYYNKNLKSISIPNDIFDKDNMIEIFLDHNTCYNTQLLQDYIDAKENLERKEVLEKDKITCERDLIQIGEVEKRKTSILKSIEAKDTIITECDNEINSYNTELESLSLNQDEIDSAMEHIRTDIELLERKKDIDDEISIINKQMDAISDKINTVNSLKEKLVEYEKTRQETDTSLAQLDHMKNQLQYTITDMETLEKEEEELREDYDNIKEIRYAVSPTKGIPLEFIEYYVKELMIDKMNELLDSVYHGRLQLVKEEVVIDDGNFTIPYKKNNTVISDIREASDGERAIMTMAFSLVLIQLSLGKYNILLLDEIDTALDYYARSKFIDLLEVFMQSIGCNQLFLISHNNMFDMYPVNVIMTAEMESTMQMSKASVIKLY